MNLSSTINAVKSVITANSPALLVGTAVAGVVATGVLSVRAGWKARGIVEAEAWKRVSEAEMEAAVSEEARVAYEERTAVRKARRDAFNEITLQEKAKLVWPCFVPPILTGASTIASVAGVHLIHTKRHAAFSGLYAVTSTKLDDYREKAEELLGNNKTQTLNNEHGQRSVDRNPIEDNEVIITGNGTELFYDDWSGRYFQSSMGLVESAINEVNRQLIDEGDAALNDFYERVGLSPIPMGNRFGWSGQKVEGRFGAVTTSDGRSAISVWFHQEPKDNHGILC